MKHYIKRTLFTIAEALFLTFLLFFLIRMDPPVKSGKLSKTTLWSLAFLGILLFLLFLRYLLHKFILWKTLHFSIHRIDRMTGQEFENFLKIQFEHLGFIAETTKSSNDYGADLILQKKNVTIAVQAKRYRSHIGVKAVQEVIGSMAYYEAGKGLVVTNSSFTKNAEILALANNVILWDRDVLIRLLSGEPMTGYVNELLEPPEKLLRNY